MFFFLQRVAWEFAFKQKSKLFLSYVRKELVHAFNCEYMELWSTREVRRAFKKLELLSARPWAILTLPSCSPNFRRISITWYTHSKHEWIFKLRIEKHCLVEHLVSFKNVWYQCLNYRASSNLLFLYAADWPTTNLLGMYFYFPVTWFVNFV